MKAIPLGNGMDALVDDWNYERLFGFPWRAHWNGCRWYARCLIQGKRTYMHRVIRPGVMLVDHRNRDGLDNQEHNLRPATKSQNATNSRLRATNSSGYRGVSWSKAACKWSARIRAGAKYQHLGLFETAIKAARAYDDAALEHHGDFAATNFLH